MQNSTFCDNIFGNLSSLFTLLKIIKIAVKTYHQNEVKIMIELSSLLFKPVIERDTSNVIGRIKNAYFSQGCTTIAYFVVSSCKQGCDALLPIADILCFADAIVVQNDANVRCIDDVDFTLFSNGIIGMEVYTQNGILKGKIQKVEFAKGGKVSKLCTENEQFTPQNVACVGDVILLKSAKQGKAKKAVIPRPEKETTVLALKENNEKQITNLSAENVSLLQDEAKKAVSGTPQAEVGFSPVQLANAPMAIKTTADSPYFSSNALKMLDAPSTEEDGRTPTRIISDYSFLLGRVLSCNLTAYTGVIIAKEGTIVDDALVEKSRRYGKLVDLVLMSKNV